MRNSFLYLITGVSCLLFYIACQKKQIFDTPNKSFEKEIAALKDSFDFNNFGTKLDIQLKNGKSIAWTPEWNNAVKRIVSNRQTFYFIPLTPRAKQDPASIDASITIKLFGYRKYLLVSKTDNILDFTSAIYIADSINDKALTNDQFFYKFNGYLNAISLRTGILYGYRYKNGLVTHSIPRTSLNVIYKTGHGAEVESGHYEEQCKTLYICYWQFQCGGDPNGWSSATTQSYDGCVMPDPGSTYCDGHDNVGWQLQSTTTQQDCQQVWVEDPPNPGGGGTDPTPDPNDASRCQQVADVNANSTNSVISGQITQLQNNLNNSVNEFGYVQKVGHWDWISPWLTTSIITNNSPTSVNLGPYFTWNETDGYTYGFIHSHPDGTAPSPDDIFSLITYANKVNAITGGNFTQTQAFKNTASITVVTKTRSYAVKVNNWDEFVNKYNQYMAPGSTFTQGMLDNIDFPDAYLRELLKAFGTSINVFSTDGDPTGKNFHPVKLDASNNVITVNCN